MCPPRAIAALYYLRTVRFSIRFSHRYDANGNMISRGGATVSWYGYNLPQTINQVGGNYSTFYYSPDRSRYRRTSKNGTTTEDRIYVSGLFEKLTTNGSAVEYRHYVVANGTKVAIKVMSTTRNQVLYLHDDHLGSSQTITTDGNPGAIVISESYDAWGKRRGSNWTGAPSAGDLNTMNTTTHIEFTGQEELDNLNLVELNGRVYDPLIARFMSADPTVQAPYRPQSLNRYSYTWNNPLNQTDPTGFAACTGSNIAFKEGDSCPGTDYQAENWSGGASKGPLPAEAATGVTPIAVTVTAVKSSASDANNRHTSQEDGSGITREQAAADQGNTGTQEVTVTGIRDDPRRVFTPGRFDTPQAALAHLIEVLMDPNLSKQRQNREFTATVDKVADGKYAHTEPYYWPINAKNSRSDETHGHPLVNALTVYLVHTHPTQAGWGQSPSNSGDGDFENIWTANHPIDQPARHITGVLLNDQNQVFHYNAVRLEGESFGFLNWYLPKSYDYSLELK